MTVAIAHHSSGYWALITVAGLVLLAVIAAFLGRIIVSRGLREPFVVRQINRTSEKVVTVIKKPITVAVLDEVAEVLRTGHYTRNIASALRENYAEIKDMVAEKIKADPSARAVGLLPFHDALIEQVTETSLRVLLAVLADPRTDELVSDLMRDNIEQIRAAVRAREL